MRESTSAFRRAAPWRNLRSPIPHEPVHCAAMRLLNASISASSMSTSRWRLTPSWQTEAAWRLHRFIELLAVGTTNLVGLRRVDADLARRGPAQASGGKLRDLTARRRVDVRDRRRNGQNS